MVSLYKLESLRNNPCATTKILRKRTEHSKTSRWVGYANYVRFLEALKNRVTIWKEKEKFRTSLPSYLNLKLKEVKRVRDKYYCERTADNPNEETRVLLRVLAREVKTDIAKYKLSKWEEFLSKIQRNS